jgi:hypothetical protein
LLPAASASFPPPQFDLDYEPQQEDAALGASFMAFVAQAAAALAAKGLLLTLDIAGCPTSGGFDCAGAAALRGLAQVNTMDTFGAVTDAATDQGALGGKWAPGFEPGSTGSAAFAAVTAHAAAANVSALATWEVHECNVGDQPQWLFDAVNAFLDAPP